MRSIHSLLLLPALAFTVAISLGGHASAATGDEAADYYLSDPNKFEGAEIVLQVAFVKPVNWKSPIKGVAFFHAATMDRRERKNGGWILVAVTEDDAAKFSKRFGTAPDGMQTRRMRGIFHVTPNTKGTKVWYVDYEGANGKALEDAKDDFWFGTPEQNDGNSSQP